MRGRVTGLVSGKANGRLRAISVFSTALILSACSSGGSSGDASNQPEDAPVEEAVSTLEWEVCVGRSGYECARLEVPIDHDMPDGERIELALLRRAARQPESRQGMLLLNPGGPGGSGVGLVPDLIESGTVPEVILDEFDLVGFDPRGVGASAPIDCDVSAFDDLDARPSNRADYEALLDLTTGVAATCAVDPAGLARNMGSQAVVDDMEAIRRASGEPRLDFLGYSYGTRLAALYLQNYPETSGRIVLDASLPPDPSLSVIVGGALPTLEANLDLLLSGCTDVEASCDGASLKTFLQQRVTTLDAQPGSEQEVADIVSLLEFGVDELSLAEALLPVLLAYQSSLDAGILREAVLLAEELLGDGEGEDDGLDALLAVSCEDDPARPTVDSMEALVAPFEAASDLFAEANLAFIALCAGWPEASEPAGPIFTASAPASLVIGGPTDVRTPLDFSRQMAEAIGGVFLRSEHQGHTVVFQSESDCVDDIVVDFLRTGNLPANGTECAAGSAPDAESSASL